MPQRGSDAKVIALGLLLAAGAFLASAPLAVAETIPVFTVRASPDLPIAGTRILIIVTPQNFLASSTEFTWYTNGARISSASGVGRASTTVATDPDRSETLQIRVVINPGPGYSEVEQSVIIATLPSPEQQSQAVGAMLSDFTLQASPRAANPGETVRAEVVTFSFDRNAASYQWYVDGLPDRAQSGRGKWRIEIPAAAEGGTRTVRVDAATPSGETRSQSISVDTVSVPLYWWADTTVPPWYRGKALPGPNARVNVIALPNVPGAAQLLYQWRFNDAVVAQASGVGRRTFSFTLSLPVKERVAVTIRNPGTGFDKTAQVEIGPVDPVVDIHELRPLSGLVTERALRQFSAPSGDRYDFMAVPFFFPASEARALEYRWTLNGRAITGTFTKPWLFTLEGQAGVPSDDALGVQVSEPRRGGSRAAAGIQTQLR